MEYIMLIISQIVAWVVFFSEGECRMDTGIIIALIGLIGSILAVAGAIYRQTIQFKKDAQRIDGVNETAKSVKEDTAVMRPSVNRTDKNVQELKEKYISKENQINSTIEGVAELLEAKRIDDAVKQKISQAVESPLYIESAVKSIYEKNASLQTMVNELTDANVVLEHENNVLRKQNQDLQNEVQKLKKERQPDRGGRSGR